MPRALLHFADDDAVTAFREQLDAVGLWRKPNGGYRTMPPGEKLRIASGEYPQEILDVRRDIECVTVKTGDVKTLRADALVTAEKERLR